MESRRHQQPNLYSRTNAFSSQSYPDHRESRTDGYSEDQYYSTRKRHTPENQIVANKSDERVRHDANHRRMKTIPNTTALGSEPRMESFVGRLTKLHFVNIVANMLDRSAAHYGHSNPLPTHSNPESVFFSVSKPDIPTKDYLTRLVKYTQCNNAAFVLMLIYLDRIGLTNRRLLVTPYNMHRLLVTALTLACKMLDDRCFSNVHYAKVGGIPTVREMNRLELQFLKYLRYRLHVTKAEYECKVSFLESRAYAENVQDRSPTNIIDNATAYDNSPSYSTFTGPSSASTNNIGRFNNDKYSYQNHPVSNDPYRRSVSGTNTVPEHYNTVAPYRMVIDGSYHHVPAYSNEAANGYKSEDLPHEYQRPSRQFKSQVRMQGSGPR